MIIKRHSGVTSELRTPLFCPREKPEMKCLFLGAKAFGGNCCTHILLPNELIVAQQQAVLNSMKTAGLGSTVKRLRGDGFLFSVYPTATDECYLWIVDFKSNSVYASSSCVKLLVQWLTTFADFPLGSAAISRLNIHVCSLAVGPVCLHR